MPRCPACKTLADLIRYERVPVHHCGTCGGYWITQAKLNLILARREVVMPPAVQEKMVELAERSNTRQRVSCMSCGCEMRKASFKHWHEIQLDVCPRCEGIWLDCGELEKCQIYWERMKDAPDPASTERATRMAELDAEWAKRKTRIREQIAAAEDSHQLRGGVPDWVAKLFGW